ncbi:aminotransferase class V-fold PLP-dependent enzyme [Virgibacillus oceani]
MIYFDQAASSFPKPPEVAEAMIKAVNETAANPGRGSHQLARQAAQLINQTREKAAQLFGCADPRQAVFFNNATVALNQAVKGLTWEKGDHIISTSFEHNSIRRPLVYLEKNYGVRVTHIDWDEDESLVIEQIEKAINPRTKLIAMTHASNVTGGVFPIENILKFAKQDDITTLVDASQTAGHRHLHMKEQQMDMLVFPGHKGVLGPQGIAMLLVEGEIPLNPIHHGGTGSYSELPDQPEQLPERLESGTLNSPGIAGLLAALQVYEKSKDENVPRETILANKLLEGLQMVPDVNVYGPPRSSNRLPIVAFNIKNIHSQEIAAILDSHYNIAVRGGLHCSPLAHEVLHTSNQGVIRASLSYYNTEQEIDQFLQAINEIAEAYQEI